MSKWRAYGQAVHPKKWWEIALCEYFKIIHADKTENDLKVVSTSRHLVVFEMYCLPDILNCSDWKLEVSHS